MPCSDDGSTTGNTVSASVFYEAEKSYYSAPSKPSDTPRTASDATPSARNQDQPEQQPASPGDTDKSVEDASDQFFFLSGIMADMAGVAIPSIDLSAFTIPEDAGDGRQAVREAGTTLGEVMCGFMAGCASVLVDILSPVPGE